MSGMNPLTPKPELWGNAFGEIWKDIVKVSIFLTIYSALLAVGILYLAGRLIVIYFNSQNTDYFTG